MADNKDTQVQPVVVVDPTKLQAPGPTEGMLQPEEPSNDPNKKPTYMVDGREVDPDGNPVGKGK